jgi:hypothetical protein
MVVAAAICEYEYRVEPPFTGDTVLKDIFPVLFPLKDCPEYKYNLQVLALTTHLLVNDPGH